MRLRMVRTLFRKEMLDTLRDRRTLLIMILLPVLIYPLFGIVMSQAQFVQQRKIKGTRFTIGILGSVSPRLAKKLMDRDAIRSVEADEDWREQLQKGKLALVLQLHPPNIPPRSSSATSSSPPGVVGPSWPQQKIVAYYVSTRDSSRAVWARVRRLLYQHRREALRHRLQRQKLPYHFVKPVVLVRRDVVSQGGRIRHLLSLMFPTLLVILTVMGAFYPAIDLTAGEKERGTLETLLTAPVSALEIVTGKYLAVTCIASFTGALNLLSLWFTFAHGIRLAGRTVDFQIGLHLGHYIAIMGFLCLVAALSSSLMIAIASLARSFKEGQNYVTPAYLVCLLPAIIPSLPGAKPSLVSACVPIVNVAYAIQLTIKGQLTALFLLLSLASMVVAVLLGLVVAARIFAYEQVLFREGEFAFLGKKQGDEVVLPMRSALSAEEVFALLGGLFVVTYYVGMPLQKAWPALGLGLYLWGVVLCLPALFLRYRRVSLAETLRLRRCHPLALVGALLMAVGALPLVGALTEWLSPILFSNWQEFVSQANQTFRLEHFGVGPWAFFFLLALSPGLCEELLFRGIVLSSLRTRLQLWPAILLTAFLFGAFHLHLYRLLPTAVLGVMLGWLCAYTGSIWPAIVAHVANNGIALGFSMLASSQVGGFSGYAPFMAQWNGIAHSSWRGWLVARMSDVTALSSLLWALGLFGLGLGLILWVGRGGDE